MPKPHEGTGSPIGDRLQAPGYRRRWRCNQDMGGAFGSGHGWRAGIKGDVRGYISWFPPGIPGGKFFLFLF